MTGIFAVRLAGSAQERGLEFVRSSNAPPPYGLIARNSALSSYRAYREHNSEPIVCPSSLVKWEKNSEKEHGASSTRVPTENQPRFLRESANERYFRSV